jgi:UDP-N-acetylmuramyl tripeptide synthase
VSTQLVGEHWLSSALAALAAALWNGVELDRAVAAVELVEPARGRMEPVPLPSGAYLLRDDRDGSFATCLPR